MSEVLQIICEAHIPGNLWLLQADLQQSQLYVKNHLGLWSGPSGWCDSHVPHSQSCACPNDGNHLEYQYLVYVG